MEQNSYLYTIGQNVRKIRKEKGLNQIDFYNKLFENNGKSEENIKKKMNKIENGKQKTIDFDMLTKICDVYNVSMDYLLGRKTEYKSYENDFVCNFTGLSEKAVDTLREWVLNINKARDIEKNTSVFFIDKNSFEDQIDRSIFRDAAESFLSIINCLFEEYEIIDEQTGKKKKHSNTEILSDLYRICMLKPTLLEGCFMEDDEMYNDSVTNSYKQPKFIKIDPNRMLALTDSNDVVHTLDCKKYIEYRSREYLEKNITRLIEYIKKKEK